MNPFDLRGPQYLGFYFALAVVTIIAVWTLRRMRELGEAGYGGSPLTDPYLIALLRGGKNELLRVAMVSLVDRGLMIVDRDAVQTTAVGRESPPRKRLDRDLLGFCAARKEPADIFKSSGFDAAVYEYERELARMRLLPDDRQKASRKTLFMTGAAVLLFFAVTKIVIALLRGRTNVALLFVLCGFALVMLAAVVFQRRTAKGDAFMRELCNLFASLKLRAPQIRSGGATAELAMLAAVWGVTALPRESFPWVRDLFPRAAASSASSSSSCGSSCGSSGCGGGGCGGGCGGCGS
jgi:uncharacterized protein (TIGR04222 family)